jgi:hypothetical protein
MIARVENSVAIPLRSRYALNSEEHALAESSGPKVRTFTPAARPIPQKNSLTLFQPAGGGKSLSIVDGNNLHRAKIRSVQGTWFEIRRGPAHS